MRLFKFVSCFSAVSICGLLMFRFLLLMAEFGFFSLSERNMVRSHHKQRSNVDVDPASYWTERNTSRETGLHFVTDMAISHQINVNNTKEAQKHIFFLTQPTGRLGNQMFDFATSMGIAKTLNYSFNMRSPHPLLEVFDINQPVAEMPENLRTVSLKQWRNETWRNDGMYLSFNLTLSGFFRVWRYFENVADDVRKSLTIKRRYLDKAAKFLESNTPKNSTLIGIHVRRGDFLNEKIQASGKTVASMGYLSKAMDYFEKRYNNIFFVVVSNDKRWCKNNLTRKNVIVSIFNEPIQDLALMILCNHTIITSGTFGWWGGWLSNGLVIYWKGFPTAGSWHEKNILFKGEYYPPHWIGLDSD